MTKKFEFNWQIPVPQPLLDGAVFDRWTEEKDNTDLELACAFKVDEYGFFIYWKSEGRVSCVISFSQFRFLVVFFAFQYHFLENFPSEFLYFKQFCTKRDQLVVVECILFQNF